MCAQASLVGSGMVICPYVGRPCTRARAIARAGKRARSNAKAAGVPRRQWWENARFLADQRHAVKEYILDSSPDEA